MVRYRYYLVRDAGWDIMEVKIEGVHETERVVASCSYREDAELLQQLLSDNEVLRWA